MPGHARHAAFQPVAAMLGNAPRDAFDLARFIGGNQRYDEMIHGQFLFLHRWFGDSVGHTSIGMPGGQLAHGKSCTVCHALWNNPECFWEHGE